MNVNAIGSNYQNQTKVPTETIGTEQEKPGSLAEVNQLNSEIEQAESEMKETAKEVQKAAVESIGGSSEKVQMLQNKMQMQQQEILMKKMEVKEIKSPSTIMAMQASADTLTQPRVDQYVSLEDASDKLDNVYRVEEKDGTRTIVFNRTEH